MQHSRLVCLLLVILFSRRPAAPRLFWLQHASLSVSLLFCPLGALGNMLHNDATKVLSKWQYDWAEWERRCWGWDCLRQHGSGGRHILLTVALFISTVDNMRNQVAADQTLKRLRNDWYDLKRLSVAKCQLEIRSLHIQSTLFSDWFLFCDSVTSERRRVSEGLCDVAATFSKLMGKLSRREQAFKLTRNYSTWTK